MTRNYLHEISFQQTDHSIVSPDLNPRKLGHMAEDSWEQIPESYL